MGLGLLGQGAGVLESTVPRAVATLVGVVVRSVAVGFTHTLAVSGEGVVYSFGGGEKGQLGHGATEGLHTPRAIEALQGVRVSVVAAGRHHSLACSQRDSNHRPSEQRDSTPQPSDLQ